MPQQINKKFFPFFFVFLLFCSLNNKNVSKFELPKIQKINISGLNSQNTNSLKKKLEQIKSQDLFFLKSSEIENILNQNNLIEKYKIFKKYPSTLEVKIQKAEPLAFLIKDAQYFSLGSNGKLIASKEAIKNIPIIFGDFEIRDFFKLKNFVDESNFNYQQITELFYFQSGRWDIKIKSGILIKLSSENLKDSLNLLVKILDEQKFKKLKVIDMRQKNQVVISE